MYRILATLMLVFATLALAIATMLLPVLYLYRGIFGKYPLGIKINGEC